MLDMSDSDQEFQDCEEAMESDIDLGPPTFTNFLKLLSSEQRRIIVTIVYNNGQFGALDKIMEQESAEAREYYMRWLDYEERNESNALTDGEMDRNSLIASDTEDDDDDDGDQTQWAPTVDDDFFENFPDSMNVLLLGETGVGKSTFINGITNYLQFDNMHQAKPLFDVLIETPFTHTEPDGTGRRIVCKRTTYQDGYQSNEKFVVGQSSTQKPKSYLISYGPQENPRKIRIIDTPGIGDTRGIKQERKNFEMILDFISQYGEIHAILILMRSNETRLGLNFRYCLNELFAHLHISASQNLLFCFTNSRQTLYRPGDIFPTLRTYLEGIQGDGRVQIPLDSSTMFCFDNESFRFLCAWREGAKFADDEVTEFNKSWKKSVKQTLRMLKRVSELPIHKVADTISINNIRAVVLTMVKPTAEFSRNQILNIQLIDKKNKEIEECVALGDDLKGKLYVDQVELSAAPRSHATTICTSDDCPENKKSTFDLSLDPTSEDRFTAICHDGCTLEGVQTEICPNPELKNCFVFQTRDNTCKICKCSWEHHIRRQQTVKKTVKRVIDTEVEASLNKCINQKQAADLFLEAQLKRRAELEEEAKVAIKRSVVFAAYLNENSLVPYNDAYKEHIDHLIAEAKKDASQGGSASQLENLEINKRIYDAQIRVIEEQSNCRQVPRSAAEIIAMVDDLKKAQHFGEFLKEVKELQLVKLERPQTSKDIIIKAKGSWFDRKFHAVIKKALSFVEEAKEVAKSALNIGRKSKRNRRRRHH